MKGLDWIEPFARGGARRRPGQRRSGTAGRLLYRIDGDACNSRRWVMACVMNTVSSVNRSRTAGNSKQPDNWLRRPDPWEIARVHESVEIPLNCTFEMRGGSLRAVPDHPSSLIGIPYDRPIVGYGGKTINTLRLWEAAAPDYFDFQRFSSGDFIGRFHWPKTLERLSRSRACSPIPTIPIAAAGKGACGSCRNISWSPARWPT